MSQIRDLFDSNRSLARPIEKVITYQNRSDEQLKAEISEYVVTDHIEESFKELLDKMQAAQKGDGGHEIGVWVSGFYGSGKSSFTKYLGFSLDRKMQVGGESFLKLLQNQIGSAPIRAMFNQVSATYDSAVVFLDLASEMLAGASMEDISTVLYLKVLQWAGYAEDLKVSELERKLELDGKLSAFKDRAKELLGGAEWESTHNQPLIANQVAASLAPEFYPNVFKTPSDFADLTLHVTKSEDRRAKEMVELIRLKSGKKNIIFIIDEVGQYVSAKPSLILNLDGLSKNLKQIGGGSVWIFATAQQTLTDDNPGAALNSPGLYKLKDRFPIQVHLEASDIKEICHRRLLTKSAAGEQTLSALFDKHGAKLRTATALSDAGIYETDLTKKLFADLYPFLPAHFEILLKLLGRLAKKTGGLGLRSAIKVVQEVLVERNHGQHPLADAAVGSLANTVTFYDALQRDIVSSFPHVVEGVARVAQRKPTDTLCQSVAKSIAILQILENIPVTVKNIAALMQADVAASSMKDDVEKAIADMLADSLIPLGEKNGAYRFLTQADVDLMKELNQFEYRNADVRNEVNGTLRSIFSPLPSARLAGVRQVTAGLKVSIGGGQFTSLEGEKESIQLHVEFAPASSYEATRSEREIDSRSPRERSSIFLLGRVDPEVDSLAVALVRCSKFLDAHRTDRTPGVQQFIREVVTPLQSRSSAEIERKLGAALLQGSFVAHGSFKAVASCGDKLGDAAKEFLSTCAEKVFDRYSEAPYQADSALAEKFLTTPLDRITSKEDPLGLVTRAGGKTQIKTDHKALISITDFLGEQVEGRRALEHFSSHPFGWSKDTTRYILAAAFLGQIIKLRISGKDHQLKSDDSLAAFASNKAFGAVGVSLREERPDPDALLRASERLRDLSGETIMPLEDEIATAAKKHFPLYQAAFGPLAVELRGLGLPEDTATRAEELVNDLTEVVSGDGSDAVKRLGSLASPLHDNLLWARNLKKALDNGLRQQLSHAQRLQRDIEALPDSGLPGELRTTAQEALDTIQEILKRDSFFTEGPALAGQTSALDALIAATVSKLSHQQTGIRLETVARWGDSADWQDIDAEDREELNRQVESMAKSVKTDAEGLKELLNQDFTLNHGLRALEDGFRKKAAANREALLKKFAEADAAGEDVDAPAPEAKTLRLPRTLATSHEIELLIEQLKSFAASMRAGANIQLTCEIQEKK
jgi:glutathione S-transferase